MNATENQISYINNLLDSQVSDDNLEFMYPEFEGHRKAQYLFWKAVDGNVSGLSKSDASAIIDWLKNPRLNKVETSSTIRDFVGEHAYEIALVINRHRNPYRAYDELVTEESANDATTMTVKEVKKELSKNNTGFAPRLVVKDISGANCFGYDFAVFRSTWNDEYGYWSTVGKSALAVSHTQYEPETKNKLGQLGAYRPVFDSHEIRKLLNER